jgi:hypothetical protein
MRSRPLALTGGALPTIAWIERAARCQAILPPSPDRASRYVAASKLREKAVIANEVAVQDKAMPINAPATVSAGAVRTAAMVPGHTT